MEPNIRILYYWSRGGTGNTARRQRERKVNTAGTQRGRSRPTLPAGLRAFFLTLSEPYIETLLGEILRPLSFNTVRRRTSSGASVSMTPTAAMVPRQSISTPHNKILHSLAIYVQPPIVHIHFPILYFHCPSLHICPPLRNFLPPTLYIHDPFLHIRLPIEQVQTPSGYFNNVTTLYCFSTSRKLDEE